VKTGEWPRLEFVWFNLNLINSRGSYAEIAARLMPGRATSGMIITVTGSSCQFYSVPIYSTIVEATNHPESL
jgi:hypothetical protein